MVLLKEEHGQKILADNYQFPKEINLKFIKKTMDLILNDITQDFIKDDFIFIHYPMT